MIIKKTKNLRVNMGNYEHMEIFGTMEVDTDRDKDALEELGIDSLDLPEVQKFINDELDEFIRPDLVRASEVTDIEDSFVFPYLEITTSKKERN